MRRIRSLAVLLALGIATAAVGQERPPFLPEPKEPEVRDLTPPEFWNARELPPHDEPADFGVRGSVEFLLFTPRQRALDFTLVDGQDDLVPFGRFQSLNYVANPGIRANLAYRVPGESWDVGFTYTYINAADAFEVVAPFGGLLYPTLTRTGMTNEASVAGASAFLNINTYDLEVGGHFGEGLMRARVYGGLRFATVRQGLFANYGGRDADNATVDVQSNFTGVGPLFGAEGTLGLGQGLGVFGRASAALLTGNMRTPYVETNNHGATIYATLDDKFALTVPVVTLGVGVTYQFRGVFFRAGYEVTNWFGLFERAAFVDDFAEGKVLRQSSNLGLDGLFLQAGLEF